MVTISLCMIVKNEEKVLARCLDSVADLVDEIIIVDTGSSDATKEIASRYTDQVYDFAWQDDFAAARNFSFSKASMDYEWPHCAFSTEMKFYPEDIVLVFSERVDDYLYSLRQSAAALDEEQAQGLMSLIQAISLAEEEEGREMIRRFEENVRREGGQK